MTSSAYDLTDVGNARLYADTYADRVAWTPGAGWMTWDGRRWAADKLGEHKRLAQSIDERINQQAIGCTDLQRCQTISKWAASSQSHSRQQALLAEATVMLAHNDDEYDVNPWLLNCTNGTLDLRLGGASFVDDGHNRADKITMLAGAPYYERLFNPHLVATPLWDAFLHRIFAGDDDLIAFVWRAIGYSLTGVASEQCLFLCHGVGKNGKSTLITAIREMLGDYAANIAPATLTTKRDGGASGDLARLRGVRMVSCEETEGNQRINESLVKQLTGGGRLTARRLYKSEIEFEPVAKIWFATNHRPDIRGRDVGIWRRIRLIPFKVQIPEAERDGELPAKLRREYPGIMSRAVEACADWQRGGLRPPACVVAATESYSQYQDVIGSWVDECCVVSSLASEKIGALYESFCAWAKASGEEPKSKKAFAAELIDRGHESTRGAHGVRRMSGIGLLAKDEHAAHAERS